MGKLAPDNIPTSTCSPEPFVNGRIRPAKCKSMIPNFDKALSMINRVSPLKVSSAIIPNPLFLFNIRYIENRESFKEFKIGVSSGDGLLSKARKTNLTEFIKTVNEY